MEPKREPKWMKFRKKDLQKSMSKFDAKKSVHGSPSVLCRPPPGEYKFNKTPTEVTYSKLTNRTKNKGGPTFWKKNKGGPTFWR